ncbi:MAG: hypothetical protein QXE90_01475 [Candidatus Micrarchaeia archaeon]
MHRKEYSIKIEPVGHAPYHFYISEPKKEEILLLPVGKFIKIEDESTLFMIKSEQYKSFLDGKHTFKGHISLAPKTMNIVQHAEISCRNCEKSKKIRYVLKSGTNQRVEKEFNNYVSLHTFSYGITLFPIGYLINKRSDSASSSLLFTKLESDVIPLSAIDFNKLIKEDRLKYIKMSAELLALLHYNGYTHNDPKLKNFLLKKSNDRLLIIDLVKMNYSKTRLILDLENKLSSPKMQSLRYDFLNLLGNAAYVNMITEPEDIVFFIKCYVKMQHELSNGYISKLKPHESNHFLGDLMSAISLHKTDKNIANIIKVLKNEGKEDKSTNSDCSEQPLFNFIFNSDKEIKDEVIKSDSKEEVKPNGGTV